MSEDIAREPVEAPLPPSGLIVAGIGAVASSIPSVERLLSALPANPGIAFVVVLQGNQPADLLRLQAMLTREARLPVEIGADGTQIEADRIYLAPVDTIMTLEGDRLRAAADSERGLVDTFLLSLAEQHRKHAIAITLAGLGSDGTLGVASVKVNGGLALAEMSEDAPPAASGQSTTAEGIADFVMPPDRIARHIVAYAEHLSQVAKLPAPTADDGIQPFPARIAAILRAKTGQDFHGYKQNTFLRRIRRRMQVVQISEVEAYVEFLETDADEVRHLFQDLLIGVTQFFRDGPEFALAVGHGGTPEERGQQRARSGDTDLGKRAERLAERYAPAYVVVDEHAEILHFSGRTGRYLEAAAGVVNLNLLDLVHRDLRLDLRAALHEAEGTRQAVKVERLQIGGENERRMIKLVVEPIVQAAEGPASYLVLFQDSDEHVQRLESELRLTKEQLQATIRELESTNEALQSANEGLDISDRKQAERRSALMPADLQHRVRNTLAVVRSLAARSLETSRSLDDFRSHFEGRLSALGRTHGVLARVSGGEVDLEELVRDELLAQAVPDNERLQVAGPRISLRQKAAELFGLALHELATNAVKYGALANPPGDISVTWRIFETSGGPRLTLEWLEKCLRPVRQRQRRRGFGSTLIEQGLPYDLGAVTSLDIMSDGVRCTIELPTTSGLIIAGTAEVE